MAIRRYQDLDTWQLTEEFKRVVHQLVKNSPAANRNFEYRDQIFGSSGGPSKHVSEGFVRFSPKEFCRFLDYAVSSVAETENHLRDGIQDEYFSADACTEAFQLARRCSKAILSLKHSQERYLEQQEEARRQAREEKRRSPRGGSRAKGS
jgi:four helix bundle protein